MKFNNLKFYVAACLVIIITGCSSMENPPRPFPPAADKGAFYKTSDGEQIYCTAFAPDDDPQNTIYLLSGITGINHNRETAVIEELQRSDSRIVVIHPRGTGYSTGTRGAIRDFDSLIRDQVEIINLQIASRPEQKHILFGHSMSAALALQIASGLDDIDGIILVNPPYLRKTADGMSPSFAEYVKYAGYMIFAPHSPIVNMAGDPEYIKNTEDRREAELRTCDPLLVKYFSMRMMLDSQQMMTEMKELAADSRIPLLLIYGTADSIVDEAGCAAIFDAWCAPEKKFLRIEGGPHGSGTVFTAEPSITEWITGL